MTPSSGAISIGQIASELGLSLSNVSLGGSTIREYSFVPTGPITMSDCYAIYKDTISSTTANVNMQTRAISASWNQSTPLKHTLIINSGVGIGSTGTGSYSLITNSSALPSGSKLKITNNGIIVGLGGSITTTTGNPGYGALKLNWATSIQNNNIIGGGGGAGGSSFTWGGGGAGLNPGTGANAGSSTNGGNGASYQYCNPVYGGTGGAPGSNGGNGELVYDVCLDSMVGAGGGGGGLGGSGGHSGDGTAGGAPGEATSGAGTYATWLATGQRYGAIN